MQDTKAPVEGKASEDPSSNRYTARRYDQNGNPGVRIVFISPDDSTLPYEAFIDELITALQAHEKMGRVHKAFEPANDRSPEPPTYYLRRHSFSEPNPNAAAVARARVNGQTLDLTLHMHPDGHDGREEFLRQYFHDLS